MTTADKRSPSRAVPHANPLRVFARTHPGAVSSIAWGVMIGVACGIGVGLGVPGRGASHRMAVVLLFALGFGVLGGVIAAVRIPSVIDRVANPEPAKSDWQQRVEAKIKAGSSQPTPLRASPSRKGSP